jgi:putative peptidoglycan lipid II flippase
MSLARKVTTVGSATLLSRLLGFCRDIGIAAVLGAGILSDAYFAALQIPNLFRRLLAEGALNSAFVPMWLRIRDEAGPSGTRAFGEGVLGILLAGLAVAALIGVLFAPALIHVFAPGFDDTGERFALAVTFVRLSVPYIALAGFVAVAAAILNAEGRVAAAAFGIVVFNCVLLAAVLLVVMRGAAHSSSAGTILSISIVVAGLAQLVLVGTALLRVPARPQRLSLRPAPETRRFFRRAVPGVVASGIPQLKLIVGAMIASSSPAAVSWLYYANRLYELPLGVVSVAIATVMVPMIAGSVRTRAKEEIAAAQSRALEIAVGLALPSAVAFAALADPIAGGLFERGAFGPHDTAMVAAALAAISAGLPGHVIEKVLAAVSFAHEDTRTPMLAALCGLASAAAGSLVLFPSHGHVGIAAAIAASGWVGASLLAIVLWRRRWLAIDRQARRRLPLLVLATAVMAAVILGGHGLLASRYDVTGSASARLATLALLVAAGLATYVAALCALRVARLEEVRAALKARG